MSERGCHYRWRLTTSDSWWTCSPSWGTGLLNDNLHQWNAFWEVTHCLLNQGSELVQLARQVTWIRISAIHPGQTKWSNHWWSEGKEEQDHPPTQRRLRVIWVNNELTTSTMWDVLWKNKESTTIMPPLLNNGQILKSAKLKIKEAAGDQWVHSFVERKERGKNQWLFWPIQLTVIFEKERKCH